MGIAGSLVVFFIAWWIAFQAMLPFGVVSQHEAETTPGTEPAAPLKPDLLKKGLWAAFWAFLVWAGLFYFIEYSGVGMKDLWFPFPER
jgi:predicted secreted protein